MSTENTTFDFKRNFFTKLDKKYPGIEDDWDHLADMIGDGIVELFRSKLDGKLLTLEGIGDLHLSMVVDTNFVLGQIMTLIKYDNELKNTFIYRLITSSFTTVYAPYKMQEELFEKIDLKFEKRNKLAKEYATNIISHISLEDAQWAEDWKQARYLIGDEYIGDDEDVPFLALALHTGSHGILSFDKIFDKQKATKRLRIDDTENIIQILNKGIISFSFLGLGAFSIHTIYRLTVFIFKVLTDFIIEIINSLVVLFSIGFQSVKKLSPGVVISMLTLAFAWLFVSEDSREASKEFAEKMLSKVKEFVKNLTTFLAELKDMLEEFWEIFKPIGVITVELLAHLTSEVSLMISQVHALELEKAKIN